MQFNKILFFLFSLSLCSCSRFYSTAEKRIVYAPDKKLKLNVYSPKKKAKEPANVLVFFHGGNWDTGTRRMYNFFGRGMAGKGIVAVVADYRLHPETSYSGMAMDAAESVKWVKENIAAFGGDPDRIFVSGHSAGAHLAALITLDTSYFATLQVKNAVKGCILIDAFGLDMYSYLQRSEKYKFNVYRTIFTKDPEVWKKGSPIYHLHSEMPPFMLFVGQKTYPNIKQENSEFLKSLKNYQTNASIIIVPRKRHAGMIFSFANPRKKAYSDILEFMKQQ